MEKEIEELISDKEIEEMFPLESLEPKQNRPLYRIHAYNNRQIDRREGAKRLRDKLFTIQSNEKECQHVFIQYDVNGKPIKCLDCPKKY